MLPIHVQQEGHKLLLGWIWGLRIKKISRLKCAALPFYYLHTGLLGYYASRDKTLTSNLAKKMLVICHQNYIIGNVFKI
jgi:hypothetical protein